MIIMISKSVLNKLSLFLEKNLPLHYFLAQTLVNFD